MSKFKIGDKCRVIKNALAPQGVGMVVEIMGVIGGTLYKIKEEGVNGYAAEGCLELVNDKTIQIMSKRTNKIFNVQVVQYAWMAVEADTPQEAMELAKNFTDEFITDEDFENSEVDVYACESYPSEIDDYEDKDRIFTTDGVKSIEEYENELDAQEE